MAQIDSSIVERAGNRLSDFIGDYANVQKIKTLGLENQAAQQTASDNQALRTSITNNTTTNPDGTTAINQQGVMSDLLKTAPSKALEFQKQMQTFNLDDLKNKHDVGKQLIEQMTPETYPALRAKGIQGGVLNPQAFPEQYPGDQYMNGVRMHQLDLDKQFDVLDKQKGLNIQQQDADAKTSEAATKAKATTNTTPKLMDAYSKDFYSQNKSDIDALKKYDEAKQSITDSNGNPVGANLAQMDFVKAAMGRATQKEIDMANANQGAKEALARKVGILVTNEDTASNQAFWNKMLEGGKQNVLNRLNQSADDFAQAKGEINPNISPDLLSSSLKRQHAARFGASNASASQGNAGATTQTSKPAWAK